MKDITVVFKSAMPTHTTLYMIADKPVNGSSRVLDVTPNLERWKNQPFAEEDLRVVASCKIIHPIIMPFSHNEAMAVFCRKFYDKLGCFCTERVQGEKFVHALAWHEGQKLSCVKA